MRNSIRYAPKAAGGIRERAFSRNQYKKTNTSPFHFPKAAKTNRTARLRTIVDDEITVRFESRKVLCSFITVSWHPLLQAAEDSV